MSSNKDSTSTLDDNMKLALAIATTQGVVVDWQRVCAMLGIDRPGTASVRWSRLKQKYAEFLATDPSINSDETSPKKTPKKPAASKNPKSNGRKKEDHSDDDNEVKVKKAKIASGHGMFISHLLIL
jgi:hypothetical protein